MRDKIYMIRRKSDGLFSTGGSTPRFTKNGKIWGSKGNLLNHLAMYVLYHGEESRVFKHYQNCEIVEVEIEPSHTSPLDKLWLKENSPKHRNVTRWAE